MKTRNTYMKERRAELRLQGICVDCQKNKVEPDPRGRRNHVCCSVCREARRVRFATNTRQFQLPLETTTSGASQKVSTERGKSRFPVQQ